jgi:hypothetical protein
MGLSVVWDGNGDRVGLGDASQMAEYKAGDVLERVLQRNDNGTQLELE